MFCRRLLECLRNTQYFHDVVFNSNCVQTRIAPIVALVRVTVSGAGVARWLGQSYPGPSDPFAIRSTPSRKNRPGSKH